jgi:4-aminobutyrate aminotransferase-like enzyme
VLVSDKLKGFETDGEELHTFANNSLSQVAAIKQIMMMRSGVLENTRKMGAYLARGLKSLQRAYPEIGDIRQAGLHIGIEIVQDPKSRAPDVASATAIRKETQARGVILGKGGPCSQVLKIKPALTITRAECDEVLGVFAEALKAVLRAPRKGRGGHD